MFFRSLISLSQTKVKELEMRIQFAEINLSQEKLTNNEVYNAISHLAVIEELYINLMYYENLRVPPNSMRLNVDMYAYARDMLNEAKSLLKRSIYGDNESC